MSLTITNTTPNSSRNMQVSDGDLFSQAVGAQPKPNTPTPSTTVTTGSGTSGSVDATTSGFTTTIPLDPRTRINITGTERSNEGAINGRPVSNEASTLTVGGSRTITPSLTGAASLTVDQSDNNVTGVTTNSVGGRIGATYTDKLSPTTTLTVSPSVGATATTPGDLPTGVTIQPQVQAGVRSQITPQLDVNAGINGRLNIGANEAASQRIDAAGTGAVVSVEGGATWKPDPKTSVNLNVTHGVIGGGNPSADPTNGPFAPGAGETVIRMTINRQL